MDISKPKYAKTLKEHLQQQQEPFSMQNYLIERSYMLKNSNSGSSINIHRLYSAKNLKRSSIIKCDLHKISKRFLHATGTLRSLLYKFIPAEFSIWDEEHTDQCYVDEELIADIASGYFTNKDVERKVLPYEHHSSTLVNMFQAFTLPTLRRSEVDTGYKPYWISSKEINRGSEWKEPLPNSVCPEVVRDPVFSTYLRKLLVSSNILKLRGARKDKVHDPCIKSYLNIEGKRSLSMKAESDESEEDLASVIMHERFRFLEKQCRQVKKITHLLYAESSVISEEWKNFQIVSSGEIHMEIGDAIFDDMVREIVDLFYI